MRQTKTRKYNRNTKMQGGQSSPPPPYSATATNTVILNKLADLNNETRILFSWADAYNQKTQALNNTDIMKEHLEIANNINNKAEEVYATARQLWRSIYNTEWVPPPAVPSPAPAGSA